VIEDGEPHSPAAAHDPAPQQQRQSPPPPAPAPILNAHFYAEPFSEGDDYTVAETVRLTSTCSLATHFLTQF
jgi:hypothetical protein